MCKQGFLWQSSGQDFVYPLQGGMGSIPGQGTNIPYAVWCCQNKKKVQTNLCEVAKSGGITDSLQMRKLRYREPELEFKSPTPRPVLVH